MSSKGRELAGIILEHTSLDMELKGTGDKEMLCSS